jgi:cytochrome c oxidase cbb3-type subunit 4
MYKEVASGIENVGIYPAFSFIVFFVFFLAVTIWVVRSRKGDFEHVSKIPISENNENI